MTRLTWGVVGERFYEAGADRGVLYLAGVPGVAWNGLTSVKENPSGGEATPYYIDGFKYINLASAEEFAATLEAFSSPAEFGPCDGTLSIQNGLFVTQQRRSLFGLCYRTMIGNDTDGLDHGYKLHMVYNALAAPSDRAHNSISDTASPTTLSWGITTNPPRITGHKPTAHMTVDSRYTAPDTLMLLEDKLYGSEIVTSYLPTPEELIALFTP